MLNGQQLISNWLLAVAVQSFLLYQTIALNCVGSSDWPKNSTTFLVNWNYPQNTWAIFLNGEGFDHINTTVLKRLTHVTLYFFFFLNVGYPWWFPVWRLTGMQYVTVYKVELLLIMLKTFDTNP